MRNLLGFVCGVVLLGAGCLMQSSNDEVVHTSRENDPGIVTYTTEAQGALSVVPAIVLQDEPSLVVATEPIAPLAVSMSATNFDFIPDVITATPGQEITLTFVENGEHAFAIDDLALNVTVTGGVPFSFFAPALAGDYTFYCPHGSHRELGMEGKLIVQEILDPQP